MAREHEKKCNTRPVIRVGRDGEIVYDSKIDRKGNGRVRGRGDSLVWEMMNIIVHV